MSYEDLTREEIIQLLDKRDEDVAQYFEVKEYLKKQITYLENALHDCRNDCFRLRVLLNPSIVLKENRND
jgi:hypothetical protein